jgi:hypothetical protein
MDLLRARLLFELGAAVYREDDQGTERARGQVRELDDLAALKEAKMKAVVAQTQERLERRKLEAQPTELAELPGEAPERPDEGRSGA